MKFNNTFVKATAAAALTITGIGAVNAVKPAAAHVQAATMRVKINFVPGYSINVWSNYNHGHFKGIRVKHGSTWNVLQTATDAKGRTWYEIGPNEWIMAKYTVSADKQVKKVAASAPKKNTAKQAANTNNTAAKKTNSNSQVINKDNINQYLATPRKKKARRSVQASGNASAVIALARSEAGKKYAWGATGPNSFDCSGLVQYVFSKAAGVNVSRTTYSQVKQGRAVSLKSLQPGDLLFWGSTNAPYHVGIYLGNNQYIHAATPSQGVIVQTLSSYFYPSCARRVLG